MSRARQSKDIPDHVAYQLVRFQDAMKSGELYTQSYRSDDTAFDPICELYDRSVASGTIDYHEIAAAMQAAEDESNARIAAAYKSHRETLTEPELVRFDAAIEDAKSHMSYDPLKWITMCEAKPDVFAAAIQSACERHRERRKRLERDGPNGQT